MDLRVAITGHVDHGKSTLIGRLLYDTGSLAEGKAEEILASSERRGLAVEWSFAVDAAQEERDQAITIETTRVWMQYGGRRIVIIDTPGHREFIKNMMSGAADADAGILVIDALEGIADQTYRHAYLLRLLDVPEIVVAVNKIDTVPDAEARFAQISRDIRSVLETAGKPLGAIGGTTAGGPSQSVLGNVTAAGVAVDAGQRQFVGTMMELTGAPYGTLIGNPLGASATFDDFGGWIGAPTAVATLWGFEGNYLSSGGVASFAATGSQTVTLDGAKAKLTIPTAASRDA